NGWSAVISPQTVEDEIKALNLQVAESVTTPTMFAGAGHKQAQKQFTLLAMLFGIIGEYGGEIRWKDDAPTLRDRFARAAANTKAGGNIQVYNEAKLRRDELDSVVRGSRIEADAAEPKAAWESVAARSPLMRVLEDRSAKYLQQATASQAEFAKEPEKILHEAELVAAMSEVLLKEGMNDADDTEYRGFAERMKKAALDTVAAVKLSNADQGRMAVGEMTQACSACHELYR
ncbi:MAG: hypothetical protein J5I93_30850, partial [Pirellulaceae bacterium]|nr:hypothetical protein [Pirellulaceae bacterium]